MLHLRQRRLPTSCTLNLHNLAFAGSSGGSAGAEWSCSFWHAMLCLHESEGNGQHSYAISCPAFDLKARVTYEPNKLDATSRPRGGDFKGRWPVVLIDSSTRTKTCARMHVLPSRGDLPGPPSPESCLRQSDTPNYLHSRRPPTRRAKNCSSQHVAAPYICRWRRGGEMNLP